jgi:diguanylate cyclase (GGDEF)-like protein
VSEDSGPATPSWPVRVGSGRGRSGGLADPTTLTLGLTTILAGVGAGLADQMPTAPWLATSPRSATTTGLLLVGFAVAFFVTELGQAIIEVRKLAYSFTLAGVPLLLGLLYLPAQHLLVVRLLAAMGAFLVQRSSPLKFAYNTAAYLLDTALVITLCHAYLAQVPQLSVKVAMLAYLALALVDLLMSSLVLLVIRINQGPISRAEVLQVLAPASAFVAVNTGLALVCAVLVDAGPLGGALLVFFAVLIGISYRGYLVLRRRHRSMQQVQEFVTTGEATRTSGDLAAAMVEQIQQLLRASRVRFTAYPDGVGPGVGAGVRVESAEDGATIAQPMTAADVDLFVLDHARQRRVAVLTARTADPAARAWLAKHGVEEALIVPVERSGTCGSVVAFGRSGDSSTFTGDDLSLLQTLTGHLAVALQGRQLVERLRFEATHDALTGLPNRALLKERMCESLQGADGGPRGLASVLLLDLNNFKEVNDAFGHPVGDQLLQHVARRLGGLDLGGATVARLGGDEFAVFVPGALAGSGPAAPDEREVVVRRACELAVGLAAALQTPVDLPEITVSTDASIGICVGAGRQSHDDLLRHADRAMYAAKDSGAPHVVYTAELDRGRVERLAMLADLRRALDREELEVHYQPKLDLTFGVVTSVEALVRWSHPVLGPLSSEAFIPLAESTGLIEQLTRLVLGKALRQCRQWQDDGLDLAVAVNLSARNVNDPGLPDQVSAALLTAGLPPHRLILEITESSIMGDPERTVPTLERLRDIGVTLSLDDFGTGYSSLSYLQRLPVREVKIDRSFIHGLGVSAQRHASEVLVRAIIGLGKSLDLRIVAEGVETHEVLQELTRLGCHVAQGYHVGRPVPAADLPPALTAARRALAAAVLEESPSEG